MAFSIKQVKAILSEHNMPVEDLDKAAEDICARHSADLDSIKEERDSLKKDVEKFAETQKELETLRTKSGFEDKYKEMKQKYDDLVKDTEQKETTAKVKAAYRELLKGAGVSEKVLDLVLKGTDISTLKLGEDGKLEGADKLTEGIKTDLAAFIGTEGQQGASTATPLAGTEPKTESRARQLAQKYHEEHYGVAKEK